MCVCVCVCACVRVRVCGLLRRSVNPSFVPEAGQGCLEGLAAASHVILPRVEEAVVDVAKIKKIFSSCLNSILHLAYS